MTSKKMNSTQHPQSNSNSNDPNSFDFKIEISDPSIPIDVRELAFKYSGHEHHIIKDFNLKIPQGEFVLLVGPTGSGKTTFIRCLNGLVPFFYSGSFCGYVFIKGKDTVDTTTAQLSKDVGMVFQNPENQLVTLNITREIAFGLENLGVPREEMTVKIEQAADYVNITHLLSKSPYNLSGGEQQRVAIASILAMNPSIMVFDEPTSNLDPESALSIMKILKKISVEKKITVIIIEHRLELLIQYADSMAVVDSGKIIAYEPMSIIFENDLIYSMGLKIPPYIELFHKLKTKGLYTEKIPKSLSSAIDKLKAMIDKRKINSPLIAAKKPESEIAVPNRRAVVSVRDVCFSYDDMDNKNGKMTLINLNLDIFEGETVAILGKNGAGKSTFVKLINGLRYPTQGDVFVYGKNTKKYENGTLTELVGMVFQNPQHQLFEDSVDKELDFSLKSLRLSNEEKQSIKTEIIEKYSLTSLISQNPFVISGGERKRLALASVMCRSPKVVILDEPTIGQDKIGEEMIKQEILNIKKDGATIIIITHDMDFISDIADRLLIIADGKLIADGNRSQILGNQDLLAKNNLIKPTTFEILEELNEKMKGQDNKDRLYQDFSWDRFEKYVLEGKFE